MAQQTSSQPGKRPDITEALLPPGFKILVTGGLGFVGSAIVRAIEEAHPQWQIWVLDKARPRSRDKEELDDEIPRRQGSHNECIAADITKDSEVVEAFSKVKPDVVCHTAGMIPDLSERYRRRLESQVRNVNVQGTRNVVNAAREHGCKVLVYTSSCCSVTDDMTQEYANINELWPVARKSSIYGESKRDAEHIVLCANSKSMATCVLRPFVIFGENDKQLVPAIHACIAKGESRWLIGNGMNLWDTVYVGNVADAHVLAVENLLRTIIPGQTVSESAAGETFFIQNNQPISFREFSLAIWKEFGHFPPKPGVQIPESLAWILGLAADAFTQLTGRPVTLSSGSVMDACAMRYASGVKANKVLGYVPRVGLEEGIRRSCQDYAKRLSNQT